MWRDSRVGADWNGWILWRRDQAAVADSHNLLFKLYVSPDPQELIDRLDSIMQALSSTDARAVKLGGTVYGLLRPDKLVVYFVDYDSLLSAARVLEANIARMSTHGVPFTAGLTVDGLLSWGVDPPTQGDEQLDDRESWRGRLTRILANGLVRARSECGSVEEELRYALGELESAGVDPETFTPCRVDHAGN